MPLEYKPVMYQVAIHGTCVTPPYPFDMAEKIALYVECRYDQTTSIIRVDDDNESAWYFVPWGRETEENGL